MDGGGPDRGTVRAVPGVQPDRAAERVAGDVMSRSGRASARERLRQERERAARRRQRNRVLIVVGSALGAIVIALIVIVVVRPGSSSSGTAGSPVHNAFYNG